MNEKRLILKKRDQVAVRMYGQGFGDCFLLTFPRLKETEKQDLKNPVYVVIDSGVFYQTPGDRERMRVVAESINQATGGKVDLLIATHEHHDHLCGFEYAQEEWKKIQVQRIWLAWTEDEKHPATQKYDHEKNALQLQAELALQVAHAYGEKDPVLQQILQRVSGLAAFAGDDDAGDQPLPKAKGKIHGPDKVSKLPDRVLDDFAKAPEKRFEAHVKTERDFCEPGHVRAVPATGVDAYVLGPPTTEGRLAQDLVVSEVYPKDEPDGNSSDETRTLTLRALSKRLELAAASDRAERETIGAALQKHLLKADETEAFVDTGAPFRGNMSLSYPMARQRGFFQNHYFQENSSRQIETEWLRGFGRLALQVDKVINNTSLVLAFRLPDNRVLLFVGDAQVGNWLSWHEIERKDWRRPDGGQVDYRPTAAELLATTVVYKVGHHGSHNATLKGRGLEMMQDGLIAFVPTSRVFPQAQNHWNIPLSNLTEALWRKTGGRVIFPHEHPEYSYFNSQFNGRVEIAKKTFAPMVQKDQVIEDPVPIWRQVRI